MTIEDLTIRDFMKALADGTPTPGGGSVAALSGAMAAALIEMAARLTLGNQKFEPSWPAMEETLRNTDLLRRRLLHLADEDSNAYNEVMGAFRLPKKNASQKEQRKEAVQKAFRKAALVPLQGLKALLELSRAAGVAVDKGNPNCITDAGVGIQLIRAAAVGVVYNVRINLTSIEDATFVSRVTEEMDALFSSLVNAVGEAERTVDKRLGIA
jgi:methenyltetrahydrofolate cyclohydrolase